MSRASEAARVASSVVQRDPLHGATKSDVEQHVVSWETRRGTKRRRARWSGTEQRRAPRSGVERQEQAWEDEEQGRAARALRSYSDCMERCRAAQMSCSGMERLESAERRGVTRSGAERRGVTRGSRSSMERRRAAWSGAHRTECHRVDGVRSKIQYHKEREGVGWIDWSGEDWHALACSGPQ